MKVSGAVAMADHVEAFGLTEAEILKAKRDNPLFCLHEDGRIELVKFHEDPLSTDAP